MFILENLQATLITQLIFGRLGGIRGQEPNRHLSLALPIGTVAGFPGLGAPASPGTKASRPPSAGPISPPSPRGGRRSVPAVPAATRPDPATRRPHPSDRPDPPRRARTETIFPGWGLDDLRKMLTRLYSLSCPGAKSRNRLSVRLSASMGKRYSFRADGPPARRSADPLVPAVLMVFDGQNR